MNRAMKRHAWSVLKRVMKGTKDWIFVVDTTSNAKRTVGLDGQGFWANSKDEVFYGQNLKVVCAVNKRTGEAIPIAWTPCLKESERKPGCTNHTLVPQLIDSLLEQGRPKLPVVIDSWFDSATLMPALQKRGLTSVIQLKSSRKPKPIPSPRHPKRFLVDIFNGIKESTVERQRAKRNAYKEGRGLYYRKATIAFR
jgi:hypothetical protein